MHIGDKCWIWKEPEGLREGVLIESLPRTGVVDIGDGLRHERLWAAILTSQLEWDAFLKRMNPPPRTYTAEEVVEIVDIVDKWHHSLEDYTPVPIRNSEIGLAAFIERRKG